MFNPIYNDWNHKRSKAIIDYYGYKFFHGKKVLDLGSGQGEIAAALARLGADVLCVDARQENLDFIKAKHPYLKTMKVDLENEWPFETIFDLTLSLGLLCHLKNYEEHLKNISNISEHVVLETEVLDSPDINFRVPIYEEKIINDLSFSGEGSIVSAANIQNKLSKLGATYKRLDETKTNSGPFRYDWYENNIGRKFGNRRLWFIKRDRYTLKLNLNKENIRKAEESVLLNVFPPTVPMEIKETVLISEKDFNKVETIYDKKIQLKQKANIDNEISLSEKYFLHTVKKSDQPDSIIRLFFSYYSNVSLDEKSKIDLCLKENVNNKLLSVVILHSLNNPTFSSIFEKINIISNPNDINIICNSNVFFDETIELAKNIKHKELYALNSWNYNEETNDSNFNNRLNVQDVWIFRGKIENVYGDFPINSQSSDNRIAYEFHKSKYNVINPSKSIKTHIYDNYLSSEEEISGPYLFVIPSEII